MHLTRQCTTRALLGLAVGSLVYALGACNATDSQATSDLADGTIGASVAVDHARDMLAGHMEATDVPGMQVAVWRGDSLIWSEGLGWADVERRVPVTPATRFPIGSVSKTLTAVAAARLVDRGLLDPDASVRTYLSDLPERYEPITPRLLGQHLSGIRHYRSGEERPGVERHFDTVRESLEIFVSDSLLFDPGADFAYSSYGFNLLSAAMEEAADQDFLTVLDEELSSPLGLEGTIANEIDRDIPFRTVGYDGQREPADVEDPSYKWAGGGLLSTAEDLVRVGVALLDPGYLSADALSLLFTEGRPRNGTRSYFGFGWLVWETREGRTVRHHNGNLTYGRAHLVIFPEDRIVVALLANTGTNIFLNSSEALHLARFFLPDRDSATTTDEAWTGIYSFRWPESGLAMGSAGRAIVVPGDTLPGRLALEKKPGGGLRGTLTVGTSTMPVPTAVVRGDTLEAFALRGTWRTVQLVRDSGDYHGMWEGGEADPPSGRLHSTGELLDVRRTEPGR